MKFNELPKFVVNLETRPDRLEDIKFELDYLGWDFELFKAVNRNSYMGCTLSHLGIINIAKERGYKRVMVIEDDCDVMPYAKTFIEDLEKQIQDFFDGTKSEDGIDKYHIGLETVSMLLYYWCQLVKRFNDVPKISPIIKKQLLWQLGIALQVKDIPLNILKGVFDLLFELQDIRWLLLFLSEHPCMTTFFTTENLKKAAQCNFARDNLQIFKNKVNAIIHELTK